MNRRNYFFHGLIAATLLFPSTCLLAQAAQPTPAQAASPQRPRREMPKPTNLQVLPKDLSSQDLMATMQQFTANLGVRCSFCHAENSETHRPDFASDAKPEKAAARVMMRMTQDIDAKYLAQLPDQGMMMKVSCGTCHRGQSTPAEFVPGSEKAASSPSQK
jgi:hypothetical protein